MGKRANLRPLTRDWCTGENRPVLVRSEDENNGEESMRRIGAAIALATVLACGIAAAPALGGKPTITKEIVDETFEDDFLTEECGVPVVTRITGHQTTRTFSDGKGRLIEVFTINETLTATSEFGTFRFKDVGADVTRVTNDGVLHQIIGQLPFWFNGTMWENPITGEVLKEPTGADLFESMLGKACAALAP